MQDDSCYGVAEVYVKRQAGGPPVVTNSDGPVSKRVATRNNTGARVQDNIIVSV